MQVLSSYQSVRVGASLVEARTPHPLPQPSAPARAAAPTPETGECRDCASPSSAGEKRRVAGPDFGASASSLRYRRSERTALTIETQDGDIVRLRFRSRESAKLRTAHAEAGGASSTDIELRTRSSQKLSIRVQGDLDAEELAAIQEAIEQAGELAEDFFDGDLQSAFAGAADLGIDGEQLARISLRMRSSERLTYSGYAYRAGPRLAAAAHGAMSAPGSGTTTVASDEASAPVEPSSATPPVDAVAGTASTPTVVQGATGLEASERANEHQVVGSEAAASDVVESEGGEAEASAPTRTRANIFRSVGGFFGGLLDRLGGGVSGDSTGQISVSLKLRIFEATLVTLSEARLASETLPELVGETVDALGAQEDESLDRVA